MVLLAAESNTAYARKPFANLPVPRGFAEATPFLSRQEWGKNRRKGDLTLPRERRSPLRIPPSPSISVRINVSDLRGEIRDGEPAPYIVILGQIVQNSSRTICPAVC